MKTIIITGAASGVGKAIAKTLSNETLILIDKDALALQETAEALNAAYYVSDLAKPEDIETLMTMIQKEYQHIDCLINNAGMWIAGDMSVINNEEFAHLNTLERMHEVISSNLYGPLAMIRSIAPLMITQGYGQIININSQSGVKVESPYPIYNASKTGLTAFRKAIQDDLGKANVRITDIHPGLINTDFYKRAKVDLPQSVLDLGLSVQDVADVVKYVFELPENICIPSLEIMDIKSF